MLALGCNFVVHGDFVEMLFLCEKILDVFVIDLAVRVLDGNQVVCRELFGDVVGIESQRLIDFAREFVGVGRGGDCENEIADVDFRIDLLVTLVNRNGELTRLTGNISIFSPFAAIRLSSFSGNNATISSAIFPGVTISDSPSRSNLLFAVVAR